MGLLRAAPRTKLGQHARELEGVIEHLELKHLMELSILAGLQKEAQHQGLLSGLDRDVVLENAPEELTDDGGDVPGTKRIFQRLFGRDKGRFRVVDEISHQLLRVILEDNGLTGKNAIGRAAFPQKVVDGIRMERSVGLQTAEPLELDDQQVDDQELLGGKGVLFEA